MLELWEDIEDYIGWYKISNMGRVMSCTRKVRNTNNSYRVIPEHYVKATDNGKGYLIVSLSKNHTRKNFYVHRLVGAHFIPNPTGLKQINHIDGIKTNNCYYNLEWCSASDNIKHSCETGLAKYAPGEKNGQAKLTETQVLEIRKRAANKETYNSISKDYPVGARQIYTIVKRINWANV